MLPSLFVVDIAVFFFYLSKGILRMKISADFEIVKNFKIINEKYKQNNKNKKLSDHELICQFKNEVNVPSWVLNSKINQFFNNFLIGISKLSRNFL